MNRLLGRRSAGGVLGLLGKVDLVAALAHRVDDSTDLEHPGRIARIGRLLGEPGRVGQRGRDLDPIVAARLGIGGGLEQVGDGVAPSTAPEAMGRERNRSTTWFFRSLASDMATPKAVNTMVWAKIPPMRNSR